MVTTPVGMLLAQLQKEQGINDLDFLSIYTLKDISN